MSLKSDTILTRPSEGTMAISNVKIAMINTSLKPLTTLFPKLFCNNSNNNRNVNHDVVEMLVTSLSGEREYTRNHTETSSRILLEFDSVHRSRKLIVYN